MTDSHRIRQLTVRGHGRATLPADAADVTLGLELVRPTAAEARDAAADTMAGIVAAVRDAGIPDDDVRTTDLSLGPELEYRPDGAPRRVGFRLTNRITVRLRDTGRVADVVDRAIAAGATTLDGVSFRVLDDAAARRSALAAAVEDARGAAEALAAAAGVQLGAVRAVREADTGGQHPVAARMAMLEAKAAADTPVLAGTSEVGATVEVTWDLAEPTG
jgi:uncharacterized protein YggE